MIPGASSQNSFIARTKAQLCNKVSSSPASSLTMNQYSIILEDSAQYKSYSLPPDEIRRKLLDRSGI